MNLADALLAFENGEDFVVTINGGFKEEIGSLQSIIWSQDNGILKATRYCIFYVRISDRVIEYRLT